MNRLRLLVAAMLAIAALASPARAQAGPATQFTADVLSRASGGQTVSGKLYVDQGRMRIEAVMEGVPAAMIVRPDKNKLFFLVPSRKTYRAGALPPVYKDNAYLPTARRTLDGSETLRGIPCDKYTVVSGAQTFLVWVKKGTRIPVQMETADGHGHAEYQNVKVGAPPRGVFEVPAGYRKT